MEMTTFKPGYGTGSINAVTDVSAQADLTPNARSVCLTNLGGQTVWVRCGDSSVAATTADYPLVSGSQVSIAKARDHSQIAFICASGESSSLHVMVGEGF